MRRRCVLLVLIVIAVTCERGWAATLHVAAAGSTPESPYSTWATAAGTIQDAVDAASADDTIVVSNGHYRVTSPIDVGIALTIRSLSGLDDTIIDGQGSSRCMTLGSTASFVSGFTFTNGYSSSGGGVYCTAYTPVVSNCLFTACRTTANGGGLYKGTAYDSTFTGNSAASAGGAYYANTYRCRFLRNTAKTGGGGTYYGKAYQSTFRGNSAGTGGGSRDTSAYGCLFVANEATTNGGGMEDGEGRNCTIVGNHAWGLGGGVYDATIRNCIVIDNAAGQGPADLNTCVVAYTCSSDAVHGSSGSITNDPQLVSESHIATTSPCIGGGLASYTLSDADIDGEAWADPPAMGCDENHGAGTLGGDLSFDVSGPLRVTPGVDCAYSISVVGMVSRSTATFGSETPIESPTRVHKTWPQSGGHNIVVTGYNEDYPGGVSFTQTVEVIAIADGAIYVSGATGDDANGGSSWLDAKATVQGGVDAQDIFGGHVIVSNGLYQPSSTVSIDAPIRVTSADGARGTIVDGRGSIRCFELNHRLCSLASLTITNGYASDAGGVWCGPADALVVGCTITGCRAADDGGGMFGGAALNCAFRGNTATDEGGAVNLVNVRNSSLWGNTAREGGAAAYANLVNCTVSDNEASTAGGVYYGSVSNCVVWGNDATANVSNEMYRTVAGYTCSPVLAHGVAGNMTNDPQLVSSSHLAPASPCRGAGLATLTDGVDIDGDAWQAPPSMGCDEYVGHNTCHGPIALQAVMPSDVCVDRVVSCELAVHGAVSGLRVDLGDSTVISNVLHLEHTWTVTGVYAVVATAFNADHPGGVPVTNMVAVHPNTIYVSVADGDDANDGFSWGGAKKTIQEGVDVSYDLGRVVVGPGTYDLSDPGRVIVRRPLSLISSAGPEATILDGGGRLSCLDLSQHDTLVSGFTFANGKSSNGGGVWCNGTEPVISNCVFRNCLSTTTSGGGGGLYRCTAVDCRFENNEATDNGGGAYESILQRCVLSGNRAAEGGGLYGGEAYASEFRDNVADYGGGVSRGTIYACLNIGNAATVYGGGTYYATAYNCTLVRNSATQGGGAYRGTARNCIIVVNEATGDGDELRLTTVSDSCSPDATHGSSGNITNNPVFVSETHIVTNSPCRGAGNVSYAVGHDVDGEMWLDPPSMGCDEYHGAGSLRGVIDIAVVGARRVLVGATETYTVIVRGPVSRTTLMVDDGTFVETPLLVEKSWPSAGIFDMTVTAYSDDYPGGTSVVQQVHVVTLAEAVIHVSGDTGDDANSGFSWTEAKATIQAGVDAQHVPGADVTVADGVYVVSEPITIDKPLQVRSANGAVATIVDGGGTVGCFALGNVACRVSGFTIQNGFADGGGGVHCESPMPVVSNCVIRSCISGTIHYLTTGSANYLQYGGGMYQGTAWNCEFRENLAQYGGGLYQGRAHGSAFWGCRASSGAAAYGADLLNCTVSSNTASSYNAALRLGSATNCIVWGNQGDPGGPNLGAVDAAFTCSPDLTHGVDGNITNAPQLLSSTHLLSTSPCRGLGTSAAAVGRDVDGEAWLSPPSMGCDEFHSADALRGPLVVSISGPSGVMVDADAAYGISVHGAVGSLRVTFDDGASIDDQINVSHRWSAPGTYSVIATAFNADHPGGVSATQQVSVIPDTLYVSVVGSDANDGFTWGTAKRTIASATDISVAGGQVFVGAGRYRLTQEIHIDKAVRVEGVDGPRVTIVDGQGATRGFYLGADGILVAGFTITNCVSTSDDGGGVSCPYGSGEGAPIVSNCVIVGCSSSDAGGGMRCGRASNCEFRNNRADGSGGATSAVLVRNSLLTGNEALQGGGMCDGTAYNCTIAGNHDISQAGGVYKGAIRNSIVYYNASTTGSQDLYDLDDTQYSCSPDLVHGVDGNITNAPMLASLQSLSFLSPCRGAGRAVFPGDVPGAIGVDFDSEPWLDPPSMGCDEPHDSGALTGALHVALAGPQSLLIGQAGAYRVMVDGRATLNTVVLEGGPTQSNVLGVSHAWGTHGQFAVVATAYNNSWPAGVSTSILVRVSPADIYVDGDAGDDAHDGYGWATPKQTIQGGVDTCLPGGTVHVADGTYHVSRPIHVERDITVVSVSGADHTVIDGGRSNQCMTVTAEASLVAGFALAHGFATDGGGAWCEYDTAVFSNCVFSSCRAQHSGGGLNGGLAVACEFSGNVARDGGGMYDGEAQRSVFYGNRAYNYGGGASDSELYGCSIHHNRAGYGGGIRAGSAAWNCTIVHNHSYTSYGGCGGGYPHNSIIWYNTSADGGAQLSGFPYGACSPDVTHGSRGCITNEPQLVTARSLGPLSPCIGGGYTSYKKHTDIDGQAWQTTPSIGCDEYYGAGTVTGALSVSLMGPPRVIVGVTNHYYPVVRGAATRTYLTSGGSVWTNSLGRDSVWAVPGTYSVVAGAFNDDLPLGMHATQQVEVVAAPDAMVYVSAQDGNDAYDGRSWATAKRTIQAGLDAALTGGDVVVAAGTYVPQFELILGREVTLRSADGPAMTVIDGRNQMRCLSIQVGGCHVSGFSLVNGAGHNGGNVRCYSLASVVSNCVIRGGATPFGQGGGVYGGTYVRCLIEGNTARWGGGAGSAHLHACAVSENQASYSGGGADYCTLDNCTVTGNEASTMAGGVNHGVARNSIVYGNSATSESSMDILSAAVTNSCSPLLEHGVDGNITNNPQLVSASCTASTSPCIGAGSPAFAEGSDIDGEQWQSPPAMGCDEYAGVGSRRGPLAVAIDGAPAVVQGVDVTYAVHVTGKATVARVDFGDGDQRPASVRMPKRWTSPGVHSMRLTAFNDDYPAGVSTSMPVTVLTPQEATIHVSIAGDDAHDGSSWGGAKRTVQAGVDACVPGGIVLLGDGTFALDQDVTVRKQLEIRSLNGPLATTVEREGFGDRRCFDLGSERCRLSGLTISGGYLPNHPDSGGGVYCDDLTPAISNCTFTLNAAYYGSGLSGGTARDCTFTFNTGGGHGGGATWSDLLNCTFTDNHIVWNGAAIYECMASNCTMTANWAEDDGGAAYDSELYNCVITGNRADGRGGGVHGGEAYHCTISRNRASLYGGGAYQVQAYNTLIEGNTCNFIGGGVDGDDSALVNCTVYGNTAQEYGGVSDGSIANTIVWGNTASGSTSDVDTSSVDAHASCASELTLGVDANMAADPMFVLPANSDFRLRTGSPCIDAGDGAFVDWPLDLRGNPRVVGAAVDMGAFEGGVEVDPNDQDMDGLPDAWEILHFGTIIACVPDDDPDGDGQTNQEELLSGTDPRDGRSCFGVARVRVRGAGPFDCIIEWNPVTGRTYRLLAAPRVTGRYDVIREGVRHPIGSHTNTVDHAQMPIFYRLTVERD